MHTDDLIERSPMQAVVTTIRGGLHSGQVGAVIARAGVGKSTFLVHVALNSLVRGIDVLHVSLNDTQAHVRSYYDEIFGEITRKARVNDPAGTHLSIERHRVIHSCLGKDFSAADLTRVLETLKDVMSFMPTVVVVDGLEFGQVQDDSWQAVAKAKDIRLWLAIRTHREHGPSAEGLAESFSTAIALEPEGTDVALNVLRVGDEEPSSSENLRLDPMTMMVHPEDVSDPVTAPPSPHPSQCTMYSGGAMGAEAYFGLVANKWGIKEVNFTFEGHNQKRTEGRRVLSERDLAAGAVSLVYVSHRLHRHWEKTPLLRKVLQVLWHMVSEADQIFVVGAIQEDGTVHGGTGWSVELARRWHKPVWVFDQEKAEWFIWNGSAWQNGRPVIETPNFAGSGTRFLSDVSRKAIDELFERSFGA